MSDRTTVELKYPITSDGVQIGVVHLRRPKVRDRLAVEKMGSNDAEKELAMIAMLADMAPSALHELDMADYAALQKALSGFF